MTATILMKIPRSAQGFTLIELLTVIAIIAVLMGLLFSAMGGVKDSGNKTKAKNDLVQIVTAVKAYYAEYGKYPLAAGEQGSDTTFTNKPTQDQLFNVLRANGAGRDDPAGDNLNPRRIVFLEVPTAKSAEAPKSGIGANSSPGPGVFFDPWGSPYSILVDGNYDNLMTNPYGGTALNTGVAAWSLGKDLKKAASLTSADDIVSWQ